MTDEDTPKLKPKWVSTTVAVKELGISRKHLYKLKNDGMFKVSKHWIDIRRTLSARATYRWNLERCLKTLETPPEKRPH
jgi:ACT domain-containing protein